MWQKIDTTSIKAMPIDEQLMLLRSMIGSKIMFTQLTYETSYSRRGKLVDVKIGLSPFASTIIVLTVYRKSFGKKNGEYTISFDAVDNLKVWEDE